MALRFQHKGNELDRATNEDASFLFWVFMIVAVVVAAAFGVHAWLSDESFQSYGKDASAIFVAALVVCLLFSLYSEFRTRTNEIYGMVSAIEKALNASKEGHAELLERLTAVEDKLDAMQRGL